MERIRISTSRVRDLVSYNNKKLQEHISKILKLENQLAEEEERLRECLQQGQQLEDLQVSFLQKKRATIDLQFESEKNGNLLMV